MTVRQKKLVRRAAMSIAALGLLIPVTVSPGQGVEANNACAGGNCCREINSVCEGDGGMTLHYYNDQDGRCSTRALQ